MTVPADARLGNGNGVPAGTGVTSWACAGLLH